MKAEQTWTYIHAERAALARDWAALDAGQWAAASWCAGWSVQDTAGHVVGAAEQTPANFYRCPRAPWWPSPTAGRTPTS